MQSEIDDLVVHFDIEILDRLGLGGEPGKNAVDGHLLTGFRAFLLELDELLF